MRNSILALFGSILVITIMSKRLLHGDIGYTHPLDLGDLKFFQDEISAISLRYYSK